ncbi:hypothetical protein DENSPDRAFT_854054 [Dentipellis sp. KUC8613]|nr:hypothetical protein DENSPDRAFT_854054 [Dentipellis sp. KUC8613]
MVPRRHWTKTEGLEVRHGKSRDSALNNEDTSGILSRTTLPPITWVLQLLTDNLFFYCSISGKFPHSGSHFPGPQNTGIGIWRHVHRQPGRPPLPTSPRIPADLSNSTFPHTDDSHKPIGRWCQTKSWIGYHGCWDKTPACPLRGQGTPKDLEAHTTRTIPRGP